MKGDHWYGTTKDGKFMTEDEAKKEGYTKAGASENANASQRKVEVAAGCLAKHCDCERARRR